MLPFFITTSRSDFQMFSLDFENFKFEQACSGKFHSITIFVCFINISIWKTTVDDNTPFCLEDMFEIYKIQKL